MADLAPPRGTQDLLPDAADAMLGLYEDAHRAARLSGFRYLETPTFEHTELFTRTSGDTSDVVTKEMYTFEDKGGSLGHAAPREHGRRGASVARSCPGPRLARSVGTTSPASSVTDVRRPDALREFRQFGVEVIGHGGPGRRRRGHRAGGALPARTWPASLPPAPELDRGRRVPARLSRGTGRLLRGLSATNSTRTVGSASRRTRCASSTARSTARRTSSWRRPTIADRLCEPCARALRGGAGRARRRRHRLRARPTIGAGPRLLHPDGVRVDLRGARREQGRHDQRRRTLRRARRGARRPADPRGRLRDGPGSRPAGDGRRGGRGAAPARAPGVRGGDRRAGAGRRAGACSPICELPGCPRSPRSRIVP